MDLYLEMKGLMKKSFFCRAQVVVWTWIANKNSITSFSYSDWCLNPLTCLKYIQ